MVECIECNNEATVNCHRCGQPLCDNHYKRIHGVTTTAQSKDVVYDKVGTVWCYSCLENKQSKKTGNVPTFIGIGLIIFFGVLLLPWYIFIFDGTTRAYIALAIAIIMTIIGVLLIVIGRRIKKKYK